MQSNYPTEADVKAPPAYGMNNAYLDPNLNNNPYNFPQQQNFNNPQFNPNKINIPPNNINYINPNIPYNTNPQMNYDPSKNLLKLILI